MTEDNNRKSDLEPMQLEHAIGYNGIRNGVHVVPGTSRTVSATGCCVVVGDVDDPHNQMFLRGHDEDVTSICISRSGRYVATGQKGHNADVCVWDTSTWSVVHRITEHEGGVVATAFSHDDKIIASIGAEQRVVFIDLSNAGLITHSTLTSCLAPGDEIVDACFGDVVRDVKRRETGKYHFCVAVTTGVLAFHLDPYNGQAVPIKINTQTFQRKFTAARYSPQGDYIVLGSESGEIALVSMTTCNVACTARVCSYGVRALCVDDLITPEQEDVANNSAPGGYKYARFGPGTERPFTFFIGGGDGGLVGCTVRDLTNPSIQITMKRAVEVGVNSLSILARDGANSFVVLAGTQIGNISKVFCSPHPNPEAVKLVVEAVPKEFTIVGGHPSAPDQFVTSSKDGLLRLWDLSTYRMLGRFDMNMKNDTATIQCNALQLVSSYEIMLSAWSDSTVRCHDLTNRKLLWSHTGAHRSALTGLAVSPTIKYYVTGSRSGDVKCWDIRSHEQKQDLVEHKQDVVAIEMFADGNHIMTGSRDKTVATWDVTTGRRLALHETHTGPLTTMHLCQNQTNFYTAGADHKLILWDVRSKEPAKVVPYAMAGSTAYCTTMAMSNGAQFFATAGTDEVVKLWDERMMQVIATGLGHSGTVNSCCFTQDDKQVISVGSDANVMVWNVYA